MNQIQSIFRGRGTLMPCLKKSKNCTRLGLNVLRKQEFQNVGVMRESTCGDADVGTILSGWQKNRLTYRILNSTPDMKDKDVDKAIRKAFQLWTAVTPLSFSRIYEGTADIRITFVARAHDSCPCYFDGPFGRLAYAFPPGNSLGREVHFDEDENWTAGSDGFNLFLVAAHELGHVPGLPHSADPRALMFPSYAYFKVYDSLLSQDDIIRIQAIYGPWSFLPVKSSKVCGSKVSFSAITTLHREVMFLKGRHLWRVYPDTFEVELELISTFLPFLPFGIQGAYENTKDQTLFFKGNSTSNSSTLHQGREILHVPTPSFYKVERLIKLITWYDENSQTMERGYPRRLVDGFPGVGSKVDAVFQYKGLLYFFYRSKQWEFNPNTNNVVRELKSNSWFHC
ncbi:PREDICTED: matrix metalloproteinase-27-like [Gavialis gangeticus]|uniref:matrix metalloproteinase-27-like n=1 Tax=Gavialis gangeticus TaxID=94835 RepID=UPI00092F58D2|nr:PREDICTED: matrix metalloproteinase-27-like [Gavialis gangeticus]